MLNRLGIILNFVLLGVFVYRSLSISGGTLVSERVLYLLPSFLSFLVLANMGHQKGRGSRKICRSITLNHFLKYLLVQTLKTLVLRFFIAYIPPFPVLISFPSISNRSIVRTWWKPCFPMAPGFMWSNPNFYQASLSGCAEVSRNKESGGCFQSFQNPLVIPSGITANVGDQTLSQHFKFQIQRKFLPCFRPSMFP